MMKRYMLLFGILVLFANAATAIVGYNGSTGDGQMHIMNAPGENNTPRMRNTTPGEMQFETDIGMIKVSQQEAACGTGGSGIVSRSVDATENGYSIGVQGFVASANPCSTLEANLSREGDRYVLRIGSSPTDEVCTECVGQLSYHVGANLDEEFTLEIRHGGEQQLVLERPQSRGFFVGLWRWLTGLF